MRRFKNTLIPTLKEAPSDAEVVSHKLMLRAGLIRKVAAGIYDLLPLGLRSIRKFEAIVREEMERAGAQELLLPIVSPAELWQESGRWEIYGKELLRMKDRHQRDFCLGPTHEEVITDLVRRDIRSYRQLPQNLFQIQTKFRDEVRPRFGLMRGREFIMKDGYSFDIDEAAAKVTYESMYQAYAKIFSRCGLKFRAVEALTGNIGGNLSHEFQVLAESGESEILACSDCQYAANVEKAGPKDLDELLMQKSGTGTGIPARTLVKTPNLRAVAEVASFLSIEPRQLLKTLVYQSDKGMVKVVLLGSHELNESKLQQVLETEQLRLATPEEVQSHFGAPTGFVGPMGKASDRVLLDVGIAPETAYVSGSNELDAHFQNVVWRRDFQGERCDLRTIQPGEPCPRCSEGRLERSRGIEVGQVFYLGTKYSKSMTATVLGPDGKETVMEMGCYGIGIGRTIAAAIEQNHDEKGIVFPIPLAPYTVVLVNLAHDLPEAEVVCIQLGEGLEAIGIDAIYDDRPERAGVKFNDAELVGFPFQVVIGKKSLQQGEVEIKLRRTGEVRRAAIKDAPQTVRAWRDEQMAV